jgi:hypothetical protein
MSFVKVNPLKAGFGQRDPPLTGSLKKVICLRAPVDKMNLRGFAKPGRHQHTRTVWLPRRRRCATRILVLIHPIAEFCRDFGDIFRNKVSDFFFILADSHKSREQERKAEKRFHTIRVVAEKYYFFLQMAVRITSAVASCRPVNYKPEGQRYRKDNDTRMATYRGSMVTYRGSGMKFCTDVISTLIKKR